MTKIIPHLWFDDQAEEAAKFYISIFDNSSIKSRTEYVADTPSNKPIGSLMTINFILDGVEFIGLNGGPEFEFNPSISFIIKCSTVEEVDYYWKQFIEDAQVLMPLNEYPFSKRYGWLNDKFGVSWQINYVEDNFQTRIIPKLMFVQDHAGQAEEAIKLYTSIFDNSSIAGIEKYQETNDFSKAGHISHAEFNLDGTEFSIMDSAANHQFDFNEAISFLIECKDQEEIDYYWNKLSADKEAEQCGWLKDKFGISWQVIPSSMTDILNAADQNTKRKVMEAVLQMRKIEIQKINEITEKS